MKKSAKTPRSNQLKNSRRNGYRALATPLLLLAPLSLAISATIDSSHSRSVYIGLLISPAKVAPGARSTITWNAQHEIGRAHV